MNSWIMPFQHKEMFRLKHKVVLFYNFSFQS